jgi:hypothetical protein
VISNRTSQTSCHAISIGEGFFIFSAASFHACTYLLKSSVVDSFNIFFVWSSIQAIFSAILLGLFHSLGKSGSVKLLTHSFTVSIPSQTISFPDSSKSQPFLIQVSNNSHATSFVAFPISPHVTTSATGSTDSTLKPNLFASGLDCLNCSHFVPASFAKPITSCQNSELANSFTFSSVATSKDSGASVLIPAMITSHQKSTISQKIFNQNHTALSQALPHVSSIAAFSFCILSAPFLVDLAKSQINQGAFLISHLAMLSTSLAILITHSCISNNGSSTVSFTQVRTSQVFSNNQGSLAFLILDRRPVGCTGVSSNNPKSFNLLSVELALGFPKYHGVTVDLSYNQYLKFSAIIFYYNLIFSLSCHAFISSTVASQSSIILNNSVLSELLEYSVPSVSVNTTSAVSITSCQRAFL